MGPRVAAVTIGEDNLEILLQFSRVKIIMAPFFGTAISSLKVLPLSTSS